MRYRVLQLTIFLMFVLLSFSQGWTQVQDSTRGKVKLARPRADSSGLLSRDSTRVALPNKKMKGFVDKNANGIDDRLENKIAHGKQKGKKDRFIDRNGDGICDGRESALGIRKMFRKRKGSKKFRSMASAMDANRHWASGRCFASEKARKNFDDP